MKNFKLKNMLFYLVLTILISTDLVSKTNFTVTAGLSLPNAEMSNVLNSSTVKTTDTTNPNLLINNPDMKVGYCISAKLSFDLSEDAKFWGGFGLLKYAKLEHSLYNTLKQEDAGYLEAQTAIYPLSVGVNYYLYDGLVSVYGIGNLSYNYITTTYDQFKSKLPLTIGKNLTDSRLGYSVGFGFEFPLSKLSLVIETVYTDFNYIGKTNDESLKSAINLTFGFKF